MSVLDRAPSYIRFLTAEQWGMDWERPPVREELGDGEAYVHHRAGNPRHNVDAEQAFYEMNEGAQAYKGYSATDYDFLVHEHESGLITVGEARGEWMSAATKDRNEQGEAVCALGYFHPGHSLSEYPSDRMVEGVAWAIVWGIELGFIDRDAKILGHRENPAHPGATGCPGDYLFARMGDIRRLVEEILTEPDPVEDDVAYKFIDIDGYQDQFLIIPVSGETKRRMGAVGETPLTLKSPATRQQLQAFFGYELTLG